MIRVLHFVGRMDVGGGIESLLMSIYRNIDRTRIQFDFAVHTQEKCSLEDEILTLDGRLHRFPLMRENPLMYKQAWDRFWSEHKEEYAAFHFHTPTFGNIIAMQSAKKHGVPLVIAHCHNTYANKGRMQRVHDLVHRYHGDHIQKYADLFFACTPDAARWGFGKQYETGKLPVEILKNGIDLKSFTFSQDVREEMRSRLNVDGKFVIGNVGRLCPQKNQVFLLEIFKKVKKEKNNAVLLLIGSGPDEQMIKNKTEELGLSDSVKFLGVRNDVPALMMAMDYYVFPSLHEGLGIVMIEAQAIGLPIVASKGRVPEEARVTDYVTYLELEAGAQTWADAICAEKRPPFQNTHDEITARGYDIADTAERYAKLLIRN